MFKSLNETLSAYQKRDPAARSKLEIFHGEHGNPETETLYNEDGSVVNVRSYVYELFENGNWKRIQVYEGVVIKIKGGGIRETVTVRRVAYGVGVERTFPIHSPRIEKIVVKRHGKVRRAKLYYLRNLTGKAARLKEVRRNK